MAEAPQLTIVPPEPALQAVDYVDPQVVLDLFWEQNEELLRERIRALPYYDDLLEEKRREHEGLTEQQFEAVFFAHEQAFVNHVLTRLTTILNNAEQQYQLGDEGIVFNIHTSLLCDVDESIGGKLGQRRFGIRPSAALLLRFIRDGLPNIRVGIVTTRGQESLDKQLAGEEEKGSLTEVSEFITGEAVGVYNVSSSGWGPPQQVNVDAFDSRMYPDYQPERDLGYLLMTKLGFSSQEAADFERDEWPVFREACLKAEIARHPQLYIRHNHVERPTRLICRENRESLEGLNPRQLSYRIITEILMQTERLAQIMDEENHPLNLSEVINDVMQGALVDVPEPHRELFREVVANGIEAVCDGLNKIRDRSHHVKIPEEITSRIEILRYAKREQELREIQRTGVPSFIAGNCYDGGAIDNAYYMLRERFLTQEDGLQIMRPNFQTRFDEAHSLVLSENQQHMKNFERQLVNVLGLEADDKLGENIQHAKVALQRLATCRRQLDEGAASVAIVVDNEEIAERLDQLFQGNLTDAEGRPVDGYALFGLPDEYRGRLFMIHVGQNAEYSQTAFNARIVALLAA